MMWSTSYGLVSSSSVICDGMVLATVYQNPSLTCLSALDLVTGVCGVFSLFFFFFFFFFEVSFFTGSSI